MSDQIARDEFIKKLREAQSQSVNRLQQKFLQHMQQKLQQQPLPTLPVTPVRKWVSADEVLTPRDTHDEWREMNDTV